VDALTSIFVALVIAALAPDAQGEINSTVEEYKEYISLSPL
jgi:hypothetical protein